MTNPLSFEKTDFKPHPKDTYVAIFGIGAGQEEVFKKFKELYKDEINIVFESKKAYNSIHPGQPRNIMIIFEAKDDESTSSI